MGLLAGFVAPAFPAQADEPSAFAFSSGTDITGNSQSGYAGGIWGPKHALDTPGFRVKALGGYGVYSYDGSIPLAGGVIPQRFHGEYAFGDLMGGRMWRRGEWTVKGYAGVQFVSHDISPDDPANRVNGSRWGAKGLVELWRNLGPRAWLSADGSYGTAFGEYYTQLKLGRRLLPHWSAGIEAGALGNEDYDAARGGVFLRRHMGAAELTLSGGLTGGYRDEETSGYVSLGLYRRR